MTDEQKKVARVADSLLQIEIELRRLEVWESEPPPEEAFRSEKPFCLDTMSSPSGSGSCSWNG